MHLSSSKVSEGRLRLFLSLFSFFRAICRTDGWYWMDAMVIIGHRSSKSTFGAKKKNSDKMWPLFYTSISPINESFIRCSNTGMFSNCVYKIVAQSVIPAFRPFQFTGRDKVDWAYEMYRVFLWPGTWNNALCVYPHWKAALRNFSKCFPQSPLSQ